MGGVHTHLQVGQTVSLAETANGFQVTVLLLEQPGQKVVLVAEDYVVFEDDSAGITTRVPIHLIRVETEPAPMLEPQAA